MNNLILCYEVSVGKNKEDFFNLFINNFEKIKNVYFYFGCPMTYNMLSRNRIMARDIGGCEERIYLQQFHIKQK